jgi:hypothetical protein
MGVFEWSIGLIHWAILLWLTRCCEGVVYFSYRLLLRRLWVLSALYPFLGFLNILAVPGDMALVFSMKETILL